MSGSATLAEWLLHEHLLDELSELPHPTGQARLQCHSSHSSTIAAMVTLILGGLPIREPVAAYGPW